MKIDTKAVHAGDRKKAGLAVPVTTPIYAASSYIYEETDTLDRVFAKEIVGDSYARFENPTNRALEQQVLALEGGAAALACCSGMAAVQFALQAALTDRRKSIVAANALFGATVKMLQTSFEPLGVEVTFTDVYDLDAVANAITTARPGCVMLEAVSNPLVRVAQIDRIAELCRKAGVALVVDSTFATPMLMRPLELGASIVVHSLTKYLAGHGDVLGGVIVADTQHGEIVRAVGRVAGPLLGPFESYLAMRGIKTFPLRFRRQCENASIVAEWLSRHPRVERVNFPGLPSHPDSEVIQRLYPDGLYGGMISVELKDGSRADAFRFMDSLKMVVRATSLGDVHTMVLYPPISSHREIPPKQRERLGIRENLVRLSIGIEDPADIIADLDQALSA